MLCNYEVGRTLSSKVIREIFWPLKHPIILHSDNQSSIALARLQGQFYSCTKHIDIWWHFIYYSVENDTIKLIYCPTEDMTQHSYQATS